MAGGETHEVKVALITGGGTVFWFFFLLFFRSRHSPTMR